MENTNRKGTGIWGFLKAKGRLWLLLGGALAGILLILLGGAMSEKETQVQAELISEDASALTAYEEALEKELSQICGEVAGVGQVDVLVHLAHGSRITYSTDGDGKTATVGSGNGEKALYETLHSPSISGVAIVCRGGNDPAIQQKLTDLVSTALGISAARVCVAGK